MLFVFKDSQNVKLKAAYVCAARNWKIIPVHYVFPDGSCSCGRPHCAAQGKHPMMLRWPNQCSDDPETITTWWTLNPDANVGIVCGASGLVVVDIDSEHGGEDSFTELLEEIGLDSLPSTVEARTGSGGRHLVFRDGGNVIPSKNGLRPGIDIKARGGLIIVPPSANRNGPYEWIISPLQMKPALIPDALLNAILEPIGDRPERMTSMCDTNEDSVVQGDRNRHLTSMARFLRDYGMRTDFILRELIRENALYCVPPLGEPEVAAIARSVA